MQFFLTWNILNLWLIEYTDAEPMGGQLHVAAEIHTLVPWQMGTRLFMVSLFETASQLEATHPSVMDEWIAMDE